MVDHAGTGSITSVVDGTTGDLVERIVYADAWGDAPRYVHGAHVDRVVLRKSGGDYELRAHLTEAVDPATLSWRVDLFRRSGTIIRHLEGIDPMLEGTSTLVWADSRRQLGCADAGGEALEVGPSDDLASPRGATDHSSHAGLDRHTRPSFHGRGRTLPPPLRPRRPRRFRSPRRRHGQIVVYELADLYLAAREESRTNLHTDFHALPFREPASGFVYARSRWYDPSAASFLTADPFGYQDSSNLYAFAGNDPINRRDPRGEFSVTVPTSTGGPVRDIGLARSRTRPRPRLDGGWIIPILADAVDAEALRTGLDPITGHP